MELMRALSACSLRKAQPLFDFGDITRSHESTFNVVGVRFFYREEDTYVQQRAR